MNSFRLAFFLSFFRSSVVVACASNVVALVALLVLDTYAYAFQKYKKRGDGCVSSKVLLYMIGWVV